MAALDIHHVALKCKSGKLDETRRFYTELFGMKDSPRPDLGFPGHWLDLDDTMFHLLEYEPPKHLDPWHSRDEANSMVDHIAVKSRGFDEARQRLIDMKADWRQLDLSQFGIWQLFVLDPNGIIIEQNFAIADEPEGSAGPDDSNPYVIIEEYLDGHADANVREKT